MCFKLKRLSVLPLVYNQIIVIFMLSARDIQKESKAFSYLLVNFNFSLDFMSPDFFNNLIECNNNSANMKALHLYWHSTFLNYKFAIILSIIVFFIYYISKIIVLKIAQKENSIFSKWLKIR